MRTYKPNQIARACDLTATSLRSYHSFGLAFEGLITGEGDGKRRHYTFSDALAVALMNGLVRHGVSRRHAADFANDSRPYFGGKYWLTVFFGATIRSLGANTPPALQDLLTMRRSDGTMPSEVVVLAVHEIAADLQRKLDASEESDC
jgi:hypothetical protein